MKTIVIIELISAVYLVILSLGRYSEIDKSKSNSILKICLFLMLFSLLVDAMAYTLVEPQYPLALRYLLNLLAYMMGGINALAFAYYSEAFIAEKQKLNPWIFRILKLSELLWIAATPILFFAGKMVVYENGIQIADNGFPSYCTIYQISVMIYTPIVVLINRKKLENDTIILLSLFNITPIFGLLATPFTTDDYSYAFGAISLALISDFLQKKQLENQNKKLEKERKAQLDNVRRSLNMMFSLSDQFDPIIILNPASGEYDWIMSKASEIEKLTSMTIHGENLYKNIIEDSSSIIHEDDREQYKAFYSKENMMRIAETGNTQETENRWQVGPNHTFLWKYNKAVRMIDETGKAYVVVGVIDTTEKKRKEEEYKAQKKHMEEQQALSDGLAREYHTVWLVEGYGEHKIHLFRSTGKKTVKRAVQRGLDEPTYDGTMVKYVLDSVHEDDRERVLVASKFETVVKETPDVGIYVVSYKRYCDDQGNIDYHQMCFAKAVSQDGTINFILAFRDADKMLREQIEQQQKLERALAIAKEANLRNELLEDYAKICKWSYDISTDDKVISAHYDDNAQNDYFSGNLEDPMEWLNLVHSEDRERVLQEFNATIYDRSGKTPYTATYRILDKSGKYNWCRVFGRILRHDDGTRELFGMSVDITEQMDKEREQQKQLEEALAMAQSANRAKTTFLNSMSHDIRTPMNAIIGFTGLAASHINNKSQVQDYLSKIGQSSNHLLSLINDVLDMSRIESGKMNLDEKPENLPVLIHTLHDIVLADIHNKQHDFFIDTVNVKDENIICDKLRLNQVLLNILSNAIKYTAQGGTISMRITEITVKSNGYATYEFCIKDNGMGMDEEYLKTLYDPFTRVKSSTVSGIQGTGLGMAITKNIVDMMGGRITVESEPGKGTQMTVIFDFKLQESRRESITIEELKGLRALVADDDANTCVSIYSMLKEIGMRSEWCTTGKEAVFRAETAYREGDLFKVYILDWLMPDMNGIETTRRIRKAIGDDVPIIILTAYDWSDIEEEAREAGVTAFVSKPMFPSDLHRVLNDCLHKQETTELIQEQEYDFTGKKILLVEDNELNREIAVELLSEYGCITDTADDGTIAVEKMKNASDGDYDVILMDIQMPIMNGYEATKAIRALDTPVSKIPIIAMTADAFAEDRKHALDVGMNDHITKPINIKILRQTLAKSFHMQ